MAETETADLHIAELHARAAEAGIKGYRLMRREALIEALEGKPAAKRDRTRRAPAVDPDRDTDEVDAVAAPDADDDEEAPKPRRRRGRRGGRGRGGRGREKLAPEGEEGGAGDEPGEDVTEEVTGTLEVTRQRHGFLRVPGSDDDVYVSASQVRRCELKDGDEVTGPARAPRRGERHRALVRVNLVNGEEPVEPPAKEAKRDRDEPHGDPVLDDAEEVDEKAEPDEQAQHAGPAFDSLTPTQPTRRIPLGDGADTLVRAVDLLAPLAFGQRVLIRSAPRSGRTTLLRGLAAALAGAEGVELTVLLIDERPEEVPAWSKAVESDRLALAPADLSPAKQVEVATKALDAARAVAASGADAVLLCDSLSRLAVAADGTAEVKRLFGSGREIEGDGSLTVIATALDESEDEGSAERAVITTETALVTLNASLAEEGITPALSFAACRAVGEEEILSERERDGLRHLRAELAALMPPAAAGRIRELLAKNDTNSEALESL